MLALNAVLCLIGGAVNPFVPLSKTKPRILPSHAHLAQTTKTSATGLCAEERQNREERNGR
jgi:hypothetical protein